MVKGMKHTEIGEIPKDWDVLKLGEFCFITKLAGFEYSKHFNSYKDGGEIIVIRGTNITNNKLDLSDVKYIPAKISKFLIRSKLFKGDLVFAYVGTIGPIYLCEENNKFHLGPNTAKIRIENHNISSSYIYNYFLSKFIKKEIEDRISIGAQPSLSMSKIRDFNIALPPKHEQNAIAQALSDTDALISSLEKLIAKKKAVKKGVIQQLLKPEKNWIEYNLGKDASLKARIGWQGLTKSEYKNTGDFYLVTGTDFSSGNIDWENCVYVDESRYSQDKNIQLKINDVLVTKDGTIGKVALVRELKKPTTLNSGVFVIRPVNNSFDPKFFFYILSSNIFKDFLDQLSAGSTINHLYQKDFVTFKFFAPKEIKEQKRIAQILSDMDEEVLALEVKLKKQKQLKQGMMQMLLTGKIRLI